MNLVFIDTETTSLRHDRRVWEVAAIVRDPESGLGDDEYRWFIRAQDLDLGNADLMSLKIGGFYARHPEMRFPLGVQPSDVEVDDDEVDVYPEAMVMRDLEAGFLRGVTVVGAVPWFDTDVLGQRMRAHGICPSWHYHLIDVEALAAGALKLPQPWDFDKLLGEFGLTYDEADRHTALGDARMVRDLFDKVLGGAS